VVLGRRRRDALARLNPDLPAEALEEAFRKLTHLEGPDLVARNRALHRLLVGGVTIEYRGADGAIRGAQAWVLDFEDVSANDWLAVNPFTVTENKHTRRPDVVLALFATGAVLVVCDGMEARAGTLTAGREWFKPWRTISGETLADEHMPQLQVLVEGLLAPGRLLQFVRDFIVFEDDGGGTRVKKMAGYHEFSTPSGPRWMRRYARPRWPRAHRQAGRPGRRLPGARP